MALIYFTMIQQRSKFTPKKRKFQQRILKPDEVPNDYKYIFFKGTNSYTKSINIA